MSAGARTFDHTADVGLEAWGPTREATLAAAARGLFAELCALETVEDHFDLIR